MRDPRETGVRSTRPCAEPVRDNEISKLFEELSKFRLVILAVSGGADSVALMALVARWLGLSPRPRPVVEVVTVDHGLRPESAVEARWVGSKAHTLGFKHHTCVWEGEKSGSGVQEAAREARYRLLGDHALDARLLPAAIVTAHTQDDQAETLLMRLARGSGIDGLSAMSTRRALPGYDGVEIVRPLLTVGRDRLVATLNANGMDWLEDPTNACLAFERVRLRAGLPQLAALGLTSDKLALSAGRLARARAALDQTAADVSRAIVDLHRGVFASIERARFRAAAPELRIRVLVRVLRAFGGEAKSPRLAKVEALSDSLAGRERVAATLGGCIITGGVREIRVLRECKPGSLPEIALEPGSSAIWDRRFRVSLASARKLKAAGLETPVVLRALGARAYATLGGHLEAGHRPPARAAAGLPSFWAQGELIAVPPLAGGGGTLRERGKRGQGFRHEVCKAEFIGWERSGDLSGANRR